MINSFNDIELFFKELDSILQVPVSVYIIGGAALLRRGLKAATKDVDMIVSSKKEFLELQDALGKMEFDSHLPEKGYLHMNLSQIFQKDDLRIDLFESEVCGKFLLSQNMIIRSEKILDLKNIVVSLCSNEDILLFKTMTERDGDIDDCFSIASTQMPNWDIILEELQNQIKQSKQDVWITWVGERLDLLANKGIDIPILKQVDIMRDRFFDNLANKLKI